MISQNESAKMIPEHECDQDIVQAHGRLCPYRVRRPTTLNSSTSEVET